MSKEKQIEEMAKILAENCGCCDNCEYSGILNDGIDCTEYKYADMLYNAGYRKQLWISVEERLPTYKDGKVLIYTAYGISIAEKTVSNRWKGDNAIPKHITHWMPLPEPPKGGE